MAGDWKEQLYNTKMDSPTVGLRRVSDALKSGSEWSKLENEKWKQTLDKLKDIEPLVPSPSENVKGVAKDLEKTPERHAANIERWKNLGKKIKEKVNEDFERADEVGDAFKDEFSDAKLAIGGDRQSASKNLKAKAAFDAYTETYEDLPPRNQLDKLYPGADSEFISKLYSNFEKKTAEEEGKKGEGAPKEVTPQGPPAPTPYDKLAGLDAELGALAEKDYGTIDVETPAEKTQRHSDVGKVTNYINNFKELQRQDREDFKQMYDKILQERDNKMSQVEWQKLIGAFMNGLSQYAAAAYGEKHGIDMSGAKLSPDFDWKGRKAEIKERINLQISKLKEENDQLRGDRKGTFHAGLGVLDMMKQENEKNRRLRVQQRTVDLRLKSEKDVKLSRRLTAQRNALAQQIRDSEKYQQKLAHDRIREIKSEADKIDKATRQADKDYTKHDDEEQALAEYVYTYRKHDYIDPKMATALIEDEGWVSGGHLKDRLIPDLIEWQTTYERLAKDHPLADERKLQVAAYQVIEKRTQAEDRENSLLDVWSFLKR